MSKKKQRRIGPRPDLTDENVLATYRAVGCSARRAAAVLDTTFVTVVNRIRRHDPQALAAPSSFSLQDQITRVLKMRLSKPTAEDIYLYLHDEEKLKFANYPNVLRALLKMELNGDVLVAGRKYELLEAVPKKEEKNNGRRVSV